MTTRAPAFAEPFSIDEASGQVAARLAAPAAVIVDPTRRHLALVSGLLAGSGTAGNLVNDAHLAALALEHNATVVSFDRDFGRFEGVRWSMPSSA